MHRKIPLNQILPEADAGSVHFNEVNILKHRTSPQYSVCDLNSEALIQRQIGSGDSDMETSKLPETKEHTTEDVSQLGIATGDNTYENLSCLATPSEAENQVSLF